MIRRVRLLAAVGALVSAVSNAAHAQHNEAPPKHAATVAAAARTVTSVSAGTVSPTAAAPKSVAPKAASLPAEITIQREVYDYAGGGRRDPYKSLMSTSEVRPLISDLRLTAVAFDPDGDNSVAILRDSFSKAQYRIRVGQQLGRLRVSGIKQKSVQFTLDEFGFNRTETLHLSSDTTKARNP